MTASELFSPNDVRRVGGRVLGPTLAAPTVSAPVAIAALALALAAAAFGAVAVGVLAVGRLAIGRATVRELDAERVHIGVLTVDELQVGGRRWPDPPGGDASGVESQS